MSAEDWKEELDEGPSLAGKAPLEDPDMDITPMIDVTFLLLIFFIVCSNIDSQSPLELAKARHGRAVGERESIVVEILSGGIDTAPVQLEGGTRLSDDPEEQKEQIITAINEAREIDPAKIHGMIKADKNVACRETQRVVQAMSKVKEIDIRLAVLESE